LAENSASELDEPLKFRSGNVHIYSSARTDATTKEAALVGCGVKARKLAELMKENRNQAPGFERILGGGASKHYASEGHVEEIADARFWILKRFISTSWILPIGPQVVDNFLADLVEFFQIVARGWEEKTEDKIAVTFGEIL
jgi:hypothetical protein